MARVFQGFPRHFQKLPVLRIEDGRVPDAETEETGVEQLDAVKDSCRLDVVGQGPRRGIDAGGVQIVVAQPANGLDAVAEVGPEQIRRQSTRETPGHADNGNI